MTPVVPRPAAANRSTVASRPTYSSGSTPAGSGHRRQNGSPMATDPPCRTARGEHGGRVGDRAPHEARPEAQRDVVARGLERGRRRVRGLDLDQLLEAGGCDPFSGRVGEAGAQLDAADPAAVLSCQDQCRPGLAAGHVQHAGLRGQAQVLAEQPDLRGTRRILQVVIPLEDLPRQGHSAEGEGFEPSMDVNRP